MTTTSTPSLLPQAAGATGEEIAQQPRVWRELAPQLAAERQRVAAATADLLAAPEARIVLTGAGSSAFVGELLAPALASALHRRVDAVATTDVVAAPGAAFAEDVPTLLVSFARSGSSPESSAATDLADAHLTRVEHLVVTCDPHGALARAHSGRDGSAVVLMPAAANDRGFAMTSSFTCMALAGWALLDPGADLAELDRLAGAVEQLLPARVPALAQRAAAGYGRVVYLGSGPLTAAAREGALKLLELTAGAVVGYHDSCLGFRHGPKSLLRGRSLAVVLVSGDPRTARYDLDLAAELAGRADVPAAPGTDVLVWGTGPDDGTASAVDGAEQAGAQRWALPGLDGASEVVRACALLVLAQVLALHASLQLGITPDDPSPSGVVNRVVQGVRIHPAGPPAERATPTRA